MDTYTPRLIAAGIRAMIGKGSRSPEVKDAIKKYKAVYFATIGGAGALLAESIKQAEVIAYEDSESAGTGCLPATNGCGRVAALSSLIGSQVPFLG